MEDTGDSGLQEALGAWPLPLTSVRPLKAGVSLWGLSRGVGWARVWISVYQKGTDDGAQLAAFSGVTGARPPVGCSPLPVPVRQPFLQLPRTLHSARWRQASAPGLRRHTPHRTPWGPGWLLSVFGPKNPVTAAGLSRKPTSSYFYK